MMCNLSSLGGFMEMIIDERLIENSGRTCRVVLIISKNNDQETQVILEDISYSAPSEPRIDEYDITK
jgi:hypothetical protein